MLHETLHVRGEQETLFLMQHMPLMRAYLCEDCNCIGNCAEQCPACASRALIGLAGVLNREPKEEAEQELAQMTALVA
ncbi:MAG: hypothetical protein ABSD59_23585 [Terracidiphilus sp.]|jgi:hypothetical protein